MLLDTCGLIWVALGGGNLSAAARKAIQDADVVYVSAISAFEVALKYARGGMELPCDAARWYADVLERHDLTEIPVSGAIAVAATKLPDIHRDPCDRFIIATARLHRLRVVTADARFREYDVDVLG